MDTGYPCCDYCTGDAYYRVPQLRLNRDGNFDFSWRNVCGEHLQVWRESRNANQRSANPAQYPAPLRFIPANDL